MGLLRKTPARTLVPAVAARPGRSESTVCADPPPLEGPDYSPPTAPPEGSGAPRQCYTIPGGLVCRDSTRVNTITGRFEQDCYVVGSQEVCNG